MERAGAASSIASRVVLASRPAAGGAGASSSWAWRVVLALCLAVLGAGAGFAAAPDGTACPADGASRLGASLSELADRAAAASLSDDPRCAARGLALADWLDRRGGAACAPADRLADAPNVAEDADLLSFRAALLWRCGRAREAHAAALAALARDDRAALAWRTLGRVLEARLRDGAALAAYRRALDVDPDEAGSLAGVSRVEGDRARRREALERYVVVGRLRGEDDEEVRGALETLDFLDALGDRSLWVVERSDLPGKIKLEPYVGQAGRVWGWLARLRIGAARNVPTLVDSGASGLHLDPRLGKSSGLQPLAAATLVGGGGEGEHAVDRGVVDAVDLGPVGFTSALGVVAEGPLQAQGAYRAILGLDVLGNTRLRFDPRRRVLDVEEADAPETADDPRDVDPWPVSDRDVPLLVVEGHLLAPTTLLVGDARIETLALIDTGAATTLVAETSARALGGWRAGGGAMSGYGGAVGVVGTMPTMTARIGGLEETVRGLPIVDLGARSRLVGMDIGAFVGEDVWARRGFELDLAAATLRPLPR